MKNNPHKLYVTYLSNKESNKEPDFPALLVLYFTSLHYRILLQVIDF